MLAARIVSRMNIGQSQRADRGDLRDVLAGFCPVEMGLVARKNNETAHTVGSEPPLVELFEIIANTSARGTEGATQYEGIRRCDNRATQDSLASRACVADALS
jgi:hypothetical protein